MAVALARVSVGRPLFVASRPGDNVKRILPDCPVAHSCRAFF